MSQDLQEKLGSVSYQYGKLLTKYIAVRDEYFKMKDISSSLRDSLVISCQMNRSFEEKLKDMSENLNLYKKKINFLQKQVSKKGSSGVLDEKSQFEQSICFEDPLEVLNQSLKQQIGYLNVENENLRTELALMRSDMEEKLMAVAINNSELDCNFELLQNVSSRSTVSTRKPNMIGGEKIDVEGLKCNYRPSAVPKKQISQLDKVVVAFLGELARTHQHMLEEILKSVEELNLKIISPIKRILLHCRLCFMWCAEKLETYSNSNLSNREGRFILLKEIIKKISLGTDLLIRAFTIICSQESRKNNVEMSHSRAVKHLTSSTAFQSLHNIHSCCINFMCLAECLCCQTRNFESLSTSNLETIFSRFSKIVSEKLIVDLKQVKEMTKESHLKTANISVKAGSHLSMTKAIEIVIEQTISNLIDSICDSYGHSITWLSSESKILKTYGFAPSAIISEVSFGTEPVPRPRHTWFSKPFITTDVASDGSNPMSISMRNNQLKDEDYHQLATNQTTAPIRPTTNCSQWSIRSDFKTLFEEACVKIKELSTKLEESELEMYRLKSLKDPNSSSSLKILKTDQNENQLAEHVFNNPEVMQRLREFVAARTIEYVDNLQMARSHLISVSSELAVANEHIKDYENTLAAYRNEVEILKEELKSQQNLPSPTLIQPSDMPEHVSNHRMFSPPRQQILNQISSSKQKKK